MRYFVIGDEETVLGFGLAGVSGTAVATAEEAQKALDDAFSDRANGIIIITERIASLVRSSVDRLVSAWRFPLIVEIPDRKGPLPGKAGIRETINAAIGIKI